MRLLKSFIIPLVIVGGAIVVAMYISSNPPEVTRNAPSVGPKLTVETVVVKPRDYAIRLASYGNVQPRTQGELKSQVSGQIVQVSERFRAGEFFEEGQILLKIDPRDFEAEVKMAEASLILAKQELLEEQARADQAQQDWNRLGKSGEPSALVLRKPQLNSAAAKVASTEAAVNMARLNFERTTVRAPYSGRILNIHVDIGTVVAVGTVMAQVYATDFLEVRLPLRNQDLPYITLPENWRVASKTKTTQTAPRARLTSTLGGEQVWEGAIIRTEGAIDNNTQQLYVIAQVDDPYVPTSAARVPLKIGQYVTAEIDGDTVKAALVIPVRNIYQGSYVYLVIDGRLVRRNVVVGWQNKVEALITAGLEVGDRLVTTPLGQVTSGTAVTFSGDGAKRKPDKTGTSTSDASVSNAGTRP